MTRSSKKAPPQVVGHHYSIGMHMILCHGPIDGVKQIWIGEKVIWPNVDDDTQLAADSTSGAVIDEPDIFGGEDKEGGVVGTVNFEYGEATQAINTYLYNKLNGDTPAPIPAFRGLVGIVLNQVRIGTSPYLKPWSFLGKRTDTLQDGSAQWYPAKSDIDGDLNPAHIIRECLANGIWGLGYSTTYIDSTSFEYAADLLYTENFGLSFLWSGTSTIEDFINNVLSHIDGILYQDISTGKFILKLARDNYNAAALDIYDDSNITEVIDFKRETYGEIINQVVVQYSDVTKDKEATATAQDIAVMNLQGGSVIEMTTRYKGITKAALANKVAARDLRQVTSMLASMVIKGNRSMATLRPNDVFKLSWPILGIVEMVVRIAQINYGSLTEGIIEFTVGEDVFQSATGLYDDPPDTEWGDPVNVPTDVTAYLIGEVPYWTLVKALSDSEAQALDADADYLGTSALKPTSDCLDYELLVRDGVSLDFASAGIHPFTPSAILDTSSAAGDLPMDAEDAVLTLEDIVDLVSVVVDTYAVIGTEIVKVKSIDVDAGKVTIGRGVLDTTPLPHSGGDRIWFVESAGAFVDFEYADGEQPGVKFLSATGKGRLAEADASPYNTSIFGSRQTRPYAPGNFKIDGVSFPDTFSGEPTITWSHRNRLTQTVSIIEHSNGNVGPEAGTTYTLRIYNEGGLLREITGLTGTTYTYSEADEDSDSGLGSGEVNSRLRFVLFSVRDGYNSWAGYNFWSDRV